MGNLDSLDRSPRTGHPHTGITVTDATQPRPFNERAALEELERLAEKIQASRRQREAAEAEFETFVKAFRHDRYTQLIAAHDSERAALATAPPIVSSDGTRAAHPAVPLSGPWTDAGPAIAAPHAWPPRASARTSPLPLKPVLAVAALLAIVLLAFWLWPEGTPPAPAQSTQTAPAASPPPSTPAPVASTGPARPLSFELSTSREVWVRVTADDRRLVERVLPANHRMTIDADRVILIRAGDGGAVRLATAGRDLGVLGKDGFPANRTLTAPQPSGR
jgi:Domain of unknown function (DUF4115)